MSNLVFLVMTALLWNEIVNRLRLDERAKDIGDGIMDGIKYSIIRRKNKMYIIIPDPAPKEKCREVAGKILKTLTPEANIRIEEVGYASSHCNYCLEKKALLNKCHRCQRSYCKDHRLPEKHNCPGTGNAKVMYRLTNSQSDNGKNDRKHQHKEEIVALEIPCG